MERHIPELPARTSRARVRSAAENRTRGGRPGDRLRPGGEHDVDVRRMGKVLDQHASERAAMASFGPAILEIGDPRSQIEQVSRRVGADLIVMGTHGRHGLQRLLLGSVAESIVRTARCPVLLVRAGVS
jgi:nucleotide-binding universal stress UspA family protein